MIGDTLFANVELIRELSKDYPDRVLVNAAVIDCYQKENGSLIGNKPTCEEEHKITMWLDKIYSSFDSSR
jgi:hypothetical protein